MRTRGTGCVRKLDIKQPDGSYKKSRYWYIEWYDLSGEQQRESSKSEKKSEAEELIRKRLTALSKGEPVVDARKIRYADMRAALLSDYRASGQSLAKDEADNDTILGLNHCDAFFSGHTATSITVDVLKAFRDKRLGEGAANATVNRNMALIRRMFNIMVEEGKIVGTPHFPMLSEEGNARQGFLEPKDFVRLLSFIAEHLRPLVMFLYETGCRTGAAKLIRWNQIVIDGDKVEFMVEGSQTKNGEPLTLALSKELGTLLRKMFRTDGPVFDATNFRAHWNKACELAGFGKRTSATKYEGLTPHDLRRSAVRNLVRAGVSRDVAKRISGHKTDAIFTRYNIVDTADLHDAAEKLAAYRERAEAVGD